MQFDEDLSSLIEDNKSDENNDSKRSLDDESNDNSGNDYHPGRSYTKIKEVFSHVLELRELKVNEDEDHKQSAEASEINSEGNAEDLELEGPNEDEKLHGCCSYKSLCFGGNCGKFS